MRILHTADWHLGRRLNRVERLDEQRAVLRDLVEHARSVDPAVVVVAGDVFDFFTPSAEAEQLYYAALRGLSEGGQRAVIVVAGNHDSSTRLAAPRALLEDLGIIVAGAPHAEAEVPRACTYPGFEIEDAGPGWVRLTAGGETAVFHLVPFPSRSRLPARFQADDLTATETLEALQGELPATDVPTFLVAHLFVSGPRHDVEEDRDDFVGGAYRVDPEVLDRYEAAFLGHLHQPHGRSSWRYAGSPVAFDFDDPELDRGAYLWEDGAWEQVTLSGGRRLTVEAVADVQEALERADETTDAWVRLVFDAGTILSPGERSEVKDAFGDRLVDIQFEVPTTRPGDGEAAPDLGDVDPEAAFRGYYEAEQGAAPPEEIVDLFLDALQEVDA